MLKVALIFGGKSAEHMVSIISARTIMKGLLEAGYEVLPYAQTLEGHFHSREQSAKILDTNNIVPESSETLLQSYQHLLNEDFDVFFPIIHGAFGEDGCVQGLAALLAKPCVGTTLASSALAMDKILCKQKMTLAGLDVVESVFIDEKEMPSLIGDINAQKIRLASLDMPVFIKPAIGGSSAGCKKCGSWSELESALQFAFQFHHQVLVERSVVARELEVAVIGKRDALQYSEVGEIKPAKEFYDYKDKYIDSDAALDAPALISESLKLRIQKQAVRAFEAIGGEGMARVDFFYEESNDRLMLNEINTLPGFTTISMYPKLWSISGRSLAQLCNDLVENACFEFSRKNSKFTAIRDFVEENS